MPVRPGPNPTVGQLGDVTLAGYPLMLSVDRQAGAYRLYKQGEPPRFGDKISQGDLRYQDFNPFESAEAQGRFNGGFGLRRYSELEDTALAHTKILEADGVDVSGGTATLASELRTETLPGATETPVWIGEFSSTAGGIGRQVVAVAGRKVFTRATSGVWTDTGMTLSANAVQGAVGVFQQTLIFGYGATAVAQYTTNLASLGNVKGDEGGTPNLYVWAVTADKAAAYAACGSSTNTPNVVRASTDGQTFQNASIVICLSNEEVIRSMAPGGSLATVYIAMDGRLGMIDLSSPASFHTLVQFQSRYNNNGVGLTWWLGSNAGDANGPQILVFTREREPWIYAPSNQDGGTAQAIGPWTDPTTRPPNIRGLPTAYQGSARWLYYAVTNSAGNTWILRRDGRSNATSPWVNLGVNTCLAMCITMQDPSHPLFLCGKGASIGAVTLPLDGEWPLVDPTLPYALTGTLDLPDEDMGFIDEDKVVFGVRITADNLLAGSREIQALYRADGSAVNTVLGTATTSPLTEIFFDSPIPVVKRLGLRLVFTTTDRLQTPELLGVVTRMSINPKLYRTWQIAVDIPHGQSALPGHNLRNPHTILGGLWAARQAGTPVTFTDIWGDAYLVRILEMEVDGVRVEPNKTPESVVVLKLLETPGAANLVTSTYTAPTSSGAFLNVILGNITQSLNIYPGYLSATGTITNLGTAKIYPKWVITGPAQTLTFTNSSTGETWSLDYRLGSGGTLTINFDPSKHTVVDQNGADLHTYMRSGSSWWGFAPGSTTIAVAVGGTAQTTTVALIRSPS